MKIFFVLCFAVYGAAGRKTFFGEQVLRIHPANEHEVHIVKNLEEPFELDFWKPFRSLNVPVDVRISSQHLQSFKDVMTRFGIHYEVFIDDLETLIELERRRLPTSNDLESFDYYQYHTFDEIQQWISNMSLSHSDMITKSMVGTSFEGREFSALTMSTGNGKPQFVVNCGIHAREWISSATCLYTVNRLVEQYNKNSTITKLLDNVDFVFIPSSNPDGYAYTWIEDRMWRKTRSKVDGQKCIGVDPNRNWDVDFGGDGASAQPCSETYEGPKPFSEKCTLAQKKFVESLPNAKMYIDIHSYSQLWMFSYAYKVDPGPNFKVMSKIANDSVSAIKRIHGQVYESGQIATTIYVASGSTADYFYDNGIPCAFAAELRDKGHYGFVLPASLIQPTAEETFAALMVMAQAVMDGKCNTK